MVQQVLQAYLRMDRKDYKRNNFNPRIKWRKIEAYTIEKQTGFFGGDVKGNLPEGFTF